MRGRGCIRRGGFRTVGRGRNLRQGVRKRGAPLVINYVDFKWALDLVAEKKGVSYRTLCEDILDGEGLAGEKNPYY